MSTQSQAESKKSRKMIGKVKKTSGQIRDAVESIGETSEGVL